jgi:cephalosporin-C deacetylase-like acetyl esterase
MSDTSTMNPIVPLMPAFLRALGMISQDPALGYRGASIGAALAFAASALERGVEAQAEFAELTDYIRKLVETDLPPAREVWEDFKARHDAAEMIFNPVKSTDGK